MFSFGIEHEVAFLNSQGQFADFTNTNFADFDQIIQQLPTYDHDYLQLSIGDAGIRKKRWYIEGFERFNPQGEMINCVGKGIEIRTTINSTIEGAITELTQNFLLLREIATKMGFFPVLASFNPYRCQFEPKPPLNEYELQQLQLQPDEATAYIYMVSYGPDLNLSMANLSIDKLIDLGQKLTYYSPYIIPFSYSSPFYKGGLWDGLSVRTFIRTGQRSATLVFVENQQQLIQSKPSLTKIARLPAEVGRIEFKACDSCDNFAIYAGLLALLKGLILDETLSGRAIIPDQNLHQISAKYGFTNQDIFLKAKIILKAAETALKDDPDRAFLSILKTIFTEQKTKADELISLFQNLGSIEQTLQQTYQFF